MARAFCVFARDGELIGALPDLRMTAVDADEPPTEVIKRVAPDWVVREAREAMAAVFAAADRQMQAHKVDAPFTYVLFGKSGTAQCTIEGEHGYVPDQYISSFAGGGPMSKPRLVCVVVIDDPGPDLVKNRRYFGSQVAAPVVRRVLEQCLSYLGVPPDASPETLRKQDASVD
jgi:cell division protein FtsI (penicillin-binding protein 3)